MCDQIFMLDVVININESCNIWEIDARKKKKKH